MSAVESDVEAQEAPGSNVEVVNIDGRQVSFAGKRQMLKTSQISESGEYLSSRFDFRNGMSIEYRPSAALIGRLAAHGAEQKIGDAAAGEKDVDDMFLAVEKQINQLNSGEWTIRREGGGMSGTSVLLRAMVELSAGRKTPEEVKAWLSNKTPKEKIALRNSAKLKPIVDRLEAEKASKSAAVDTDALLADFA